MGTGIKKAFAIASAALILLLVSLGITASHYHRQYLKAEKRADNAETLAQQRQQTIRDMQEHQRNLEALDAKYTKELADAKTANDGLLRKLDHGSRVLVKGRCPSTTRTAARTSGMDDAGTIELSPTAGRNVLSIRKGILSDQAALKGLQQYIKEQCLN